MILIADIQRTVADRHHVSVRALKGRRGNRQVIRSRHAAMYLSRQLTRHSYETIGKHFGGRDHSTVLHGCRKVQSRLHQQKTQAFIGEMIDKLSSRYSGDKSPLSIVPSPTNGA